MKIEKAKLFHQIYKIDMMDNYYMWTEGDPSVKSRAWMQSEKELVCQQKTLMMLYRC